MKSKRAKRKTEAVKARRNLRRRKRKKKNKLRKTEKPSIGYKHSNTISNAANKIVSLEIRMKQVNFQWKEI